jgi:FAD/FMN-containing dehydrogenase
VAVAGLYAGPVEEGEEALRAVREFGPPAADLFGVVPYAEFQCSLDDPPGYRNWWTAEYLPDLSDGAIDAIAARSERIPAGASQLFMVPWGGQVARSPEGETPLAGRDARYIVHPLFLWEDAADDAAMIELGRGYRADLAPFATGGNYLNFTGDEGEARLRAAYGASYERLLRVKAEWDPAGVFDPHRVRD